MFGNIEIISKSLGGSATIKCTCLSCKKVCQFITSAKTDGMRTDISKRICAASFLSGGTPTSTVRFLGLLGVSSLSRNSITESNQQLSTIISAETNKVLSMAQEEYLNKHGNSWIVSVDFTWDSRNKGKMGTLTCSDPYSGKNLFRIHIHRAGHKKNFEVIIY